MDWRSCEEGFQKDRRRFGDGLDTNLRRFGEDMNWDWICVVFLMDWRRCQIQALFPIGSRIEELKSDDSSVKISRVPAAGWVG